MEIHKLRAEVASAEERGKARADTTIGFFAEQLAAQLQPMLPAYAADAHCTRPSDIRDAWTTMDSHVEVADVGTCPCLVAGSGLLHKSVQTEPATMDASEQTEMAGADGDVTALRWTHVLIADAVGEAVAEAVGCDVSQVGPTLNLLRCWRRAPWSARLYV